MKCIIGLGNPGAEYELTRHNVGFLAVDVLAKALDTTFTQERKFEAEIAHAKLNGERVVLVKPLTFMNESGRSVKTVLSYYKCGVANLIVLYDDKDLMFGDIRVRHKGSAAGHRGVLSIINAMDENFTRVRIGTANENTGRIQTRLFVLKPFGAEEQKQLPEILERATELALENA